MGVMDAEGCAPRTIDVEGDPPNLMEGTCDRLRPPFLDKQAATAAIQNPAALWKLQNLRRMKG